MGARRYGISLLVFNSISHKNTRRESIPPRAHVLFCLLYKRLTNKKKPEESPKTQSTLELEEAVWRPLRQAVTHQVINSVKQGPVVQRMDRAVQRINTTNTYWVIQWIALSTLWATGARAWLRWTDRNRVRLKTSSSHKSTLFLTEHNSIIVNLAHL